MFTDLTVIDITSDRPVLREVAPRYSAAATEPRLVVTEEPAEIVA